MPRNSSGTYSLPAGNPVVANTLIQVDWANPTMSDIGQALTESLDRFGRGGMLAQLKLADGTAAQPAFAFNSESSTGLYHSGAGSLLFSVLGTPLISMTSTAVNFGGIPTWAADPTSGDQLTRKSYVDTRVATAAFLPLTGGTLSGPGNLVVAGTLGIGGVTNITRPGGVNTNTYLNWTDTTTTTGYLGIRSSVYGVAAATIGGDGAIGFSTGQGGVANAFNARALLDTSGNFGLGSAPLNTSANRIAFSVNGTASATISLGVAGSAVAVAYADAGLFSLGANGPITLNPGNAEKARLDQLGNFGVNSAPLGTAANRAVISVNGTASTLYGMGIAGSLVGGIYSDSGILSIGHNAAIAFSPGNVEAMRLSAAGVATYGGIEIGYRDVPRVTGGLERGKCFATSSNVTINAATAGNLFSIYNDSAAAITLTQGTVTLRLGGTTTTGSRTLAARGLATIWYNAAGEAIASGAGVS